MTRKLCNNTFMYKKDRFKDSCFVKVPVGKNFFNDQHNKGGLKLICKFNDCILYRQGQMLSNGVIKLQAKWNLYNFKKSNSIN